MKTNYIVELETDGYKVICGNAESRETFYTYGEAYFASQADEIAHGEYDEESDIQLISPIEWV